MAVLGAIIELIAVTQLNLFGRVWGFHALVGGSLLAIVGTQVMALGICAHAYATYFMNESDRWFDRMRARFKLEHGLAVGGAVHARRADRRRRHRRRLGQPRLRRARLRVPVGARGDAHHHRDPGVLHVVPDLDPRAAPARSEPVARLSAAERRLVSAQRAP